jgi:hypothetical protein
MKHIDAEISMVCRTIHLFKAGTMEHIKIAWHLVYFVVIQDELNMTYTVKVIWEKTAGVAFSDNKYSREHKWVFDGGTVVPGSSSPHVVPLPYSSEAAVALRISKTITSDG